jgi:hypothetical protein
MSTWDLSVSGEILSRFKIIGSPMGALGKCHAMKYLGETAPAVEVCGIC